MNKILITGSRNASGAMLQKARDVTIKCVKNGCHIVVGDAGGIDTEVIRTAGGFRYSHITVWGAKGFQRVMTVYGENKFTKAGYIERDSIMAASCDKCVAIWDGQSRGTRATFTFAINLARPTVVFNFSEKTKSVFRTDNGKVKRKVVAWK